MTAAGDVSNAATFDAAYNPQCAIATRTAVQALANNTTTAISFDGEEFDNAGIFTATSTTFTVPATGVYLLAAVITYASNATGFRGVEIYVNAAGLDGCYSPAISGTNHRQNYSMPFLLSSGDAVEFHGFQTSGGSLNVTTARGSITRQSG